MGFLKSWFGGDDSGTDVQYLPSSYTTTIGSPDVTTDTTISKAEAPKKAETADTSEYDAGVQRRRKKNGVRGTFTSGVKVDDGAIGA